MADGLHEQERLILERRPALRSVVVMGLRRLVGLAWLGVMGVWLVASATAPVLGQWVVGIAIVATLLLLSWLSIVRDAMRFRLTDRRISARAGVFGVVSADAPLEQVTNVIVVRTFAQRLLGLGTIGCFTASDAGTIGWTHVDGSGGLAARINRAIDEAKIRPGAPAASVDPSARASRRGPMSMKASDGRPSSADAAGTPTPLPRLPVLGIAGGIGAGKSTVARAFAELGCHVIDSDQRARAALDRPDVREQLVSWWGPGVLGEGGRIERAKVASIIFGDAGERARLEALVHPIVRQERAAMIREAREARAAGVIVDAPLLFEAGVDAECDAVVFVDAPADVRLARVQASRGWTLEELERRERAQLSLDQKRARCRYVIDNGGVEGASGQRPLAEQAGEVLDDARSRWAAPGIVVDG